SSSGLRSSSASSRTLAWNSRRLNSRLKNNSDFEATALSSVRLGNSCTVVSLLTTVDMVIWVIIVMPDFRTSQFLTQGEHTLAKVWASSVPFGNYEAMSELKV